MVQGLKTESEWWRETTIYQVCPRSFADANGDGIGDLPGIISRLDYIKKLGFETIWLSPHYPSPQRDFGYDITDFCGVAPEYGRLDDAVKLIEEVHRRGMKILFDMVLNHTSDEHPWFRESRASRDNPRRDWYIWRSGKGRRPPNNWAAIPGGPSWRYDRTTEQWYLQSFLPFQPDLNFRNPEVKAAMFDAMRFWLDRGVDGFRLDIFHKIFKDDRFRNNPISWRFIPTRDLDEGYFQKLRYNRNRPETFALAKEVRAVVDTYRPPRFVVGEVFGKGVIKRYLGENHDGLNLILLFDLVNQSRMTARHIKAIIRAYEAEYPHPHLPTYALGNHDRRRYMSRIGGNAALARLLAFFLYTARGVPINYYGDEIGIPDSDFPHKDARDAIAHAYWWVPRAIARKLDLYINRDGCRTPMQWDPSVNAGFSPEGATPWLPVHPGYRTCNVSNQQEDAFSILNTHRKLLQLRRRHACLRRGVLELLPEGSVPEEVVGYDRKLEGETIRVMMNFSRNPRSVRLDGVPGEALACSDTACTAMRDQVCLGAFGGMLLGSPVSDGSDPCSEK